MAEFTKGPWGVTESLDHNDNPCVTVTGHDDETIYEIVAADAKDRANAHLIAAAPELYDALDRLMNLNHFHLEDCIYEVREAVLSDEDYDGNTWDHPDVTAFSETVEKIKTALAKARGEK